MIRNYYASLVSLGMAGGYGYDSAALAKRKKRPISELKPTEIVFRASIRYLVETEGLLEKGEFCAAVGRGPQWYSDAITGTDGISLEQLDMAARALSVSPQQLLEGPDLLRHRDAIHPALHKAGEHGSPQARVRESEEDSTTADGIADVIARLGTLYKTLRDGAPSRKARGGKSRRGHRN